MSRFLLSLSAIFLLPLMLAANHVTAQQTGRVSAFSTCIDERGESGLCTMHGRDIAEGFSAGELRGFASLRASSHGFYMPNDVCAAAAVPEVLTVEPLYSSPALGDKLYFDDLIIEAFDSAGQLIAEYPVVLVALSQPGAVASDAEWDYVEFAKPGLSLLMVFPYCDLSISDPEAQAVGSVQFSVGL